MRTRLLIYGFFLIASALAITRITDAYVDYQVSALRLAARPTQATPEQLPKTLPPNEDEHKMQICPASMPCAQRILRQI